MKEQDSGTEKRTVRGLMRGCHRAGGKNKEAVWEDGWRHGQRERKGVKKTHYGRNYRDGGMDARTGRLKQGA